jgi:hypothetical protein
MLRLWFVASCEEDVCKLFGSVPIPLRFGMNKAFVPAYRLVFSVAAKKMAER